MAPCRFFLQGFCKFGDRCRFDHPGAQSQPRGNQQNQNRFAPLNNNAGGGGGGNRGARGGQRQDFRFNLDPETIRVDLTNDRPIWPFSVYAPGRSAPRQLIEGSTLEQSPEEVRLRYYAAMSAGNPQQAAADEAQLSNQVDSQVQAILNDLNGACRYVQEGENAHPNRVDICKQSGGAGGQQQPANTFARGSTGLGQRSAFGAPAKPPAQQGTSFAQASAFGAPSGQQSAFGNPPTFGAAAGQQGAFGSPSLGANPAFGKPAFGSPAGFGQAANPGAPTSAAPAFGQPSQPGAFGQPAASSFGAKPAFGQPAGGGGFGQPAQAGNFGNPTGTPAFGQSGFGQPAQPAAPSAFGQPAQPAAPSAFGQPVTQQPVPGTFGQSVTQQPIAGTFGQPAARPSPFGTPAAPQQVPQAGTFGTPAQPTTSGVFGTPAQPAVSGGFGVPASTATDNAFGKPPSAPSLTNGFGQPAAHNQPQPTTNGATPAAATGAHVSTYSTRAQNGQLTSWKGLPVSYINGNPCYRRPDDNQWERIWHPDGPPPENAYCHAPPEAYSDVVKEAYKSLNETGSFKDGIMPEEPPMAEMVGWDL